MTQEFRGPVGDVAGRDIINHHHGSGRLLTREERRALNNLVKQLEEEFGEPGRQTWKSIHNILGIDSIEVMHLEHFKPTEAMLQLLIENAQLRQSAADGADEDALRLQLDQSASALTKLTERNSELVAQLKGARQAKADLEARLNQQSDELQNTTAKLNRALGEPKRVVGMCPQCKTSSALIATARKRLIVLTLAVVALTVTAGFFGFKAYASASAVRAAEARLQRCEFDGNTYTVGSIIDNKDAADLECVLGKDGAPPQWHPIDSKVALTRGQAQPQRQTKPRGKVKRAPQHPAAEVQAEQAASAESGMTRLF
ncbi:hypothetical protein LH427_04810 [Laribacter hongkongensis]|uniref:hypothetical protein n=1 Tax=Laribacter hongkongensis TaxID=168471 RepID=UPI001EFCA8DD|nr:hypothetical protein [Laribacter hongkongensis]MCG8991467.1 hypothetical protein [Laribacter hongkongensis]MCG8997723.1 hypothetical protein [Laribacter hongkongensis]MCG9001251.1 hypothetical protein [Laribacter hongkongensis]MCG9003053.1 hypothetical protein [Laribacter hongkongensis]MCG9007459.1 hypothetical protein [Laribacter hongkongensis]